MAAVASSSLDLVLERKNLQDKLTSLRRSIEVGVEGMEKSKEGRDLRRKECVLKVMKMILASLEAQDREVMNEMKSEAFDLLRLFNKFETELSQLSSAISSSQDDGSQLLSDIRVLDKKVDRLDVQKFVESLNLTVDSGFVDSSSVMETMRDAVQLNTGDVSPRSFTLVIPDIESHILKLEVHANQEGLSFNSFILKRLVFSVGFADLENCPLWCKLENKTGQISPDGKIFTFRMRRRVIECKLSVKFLSSNISGSPQLLGAVKSQSDPHQTSSLATVGQKLTRNLSDDSSTDQDPPLKMARLEAGGCFKSPLTQATLSSAMECEERREQRPVETAREAGGQEAAASIWDKSAILPGEDCNATLQLELDFDGGQTEEEMEEEPPLLSSVPPLPSDLVNPPTPTPTSLWKKLTSQPTASRFDFLLDLEEVGAYGAMIVGERRRRCDMALINPNDVAYVPLQNCFLVSEPTLNRIGVYEAESFTFVRWLAHPDNHTSCCFNMPMSMLCLRNGDVLILEKDRIWILDSQLRGIQYKMGSFSGLAEGNAGEVFTLAHLREDGVYSIQKLVVRSDRNYWFDGQIKLHVIEHFSNPLARKNSKPRFLTHSNNKLFITDLGISKLYMVDLVTGSQKDFGCFGSSDGDFHKPAGIVSDDNGHLLIADRNNRRLLVFNEKGEFLKVAREETLSNNKLVLVQSLRRFREFLIVVQMARRENPVSGRVVCYKLKDKAKS